MRKLDERTDGRRVGERKAQGERRVYLRVRLAADLAKQLRVAMIEDEREWSALAEELIAAWLRKRSASRARRRDISDGVEA